MLSNDVRLLRLSTSNSTPNSSSTAVTRVAIATESQVSTVSTLAFVICGSGMPGKTAEKHRTRRGSISFTLTLLDRQMRWRTIPETLVTSKSVDYPQKIPKSALVEVSPSVDFAEY